MSVRTVLVGLGGYGNGYVDAILDHGIQNDVEIVGAVDPNPIGCSRKAELEWVAGSIDDTLEEFYQHARADLAVISAPIQYHAPFSLTALSHGTNILCEKPIAGTVAEALAMRAAAIKAKRTIAIGYQWSYSETIAAIARDVRAGRFGVPRALRALVFWPRTLGYYGRNNWAGRLRTADGRPVMDSPVNNAAAHYLHNAFQVLGRTAGQPVSVEAELYRANDIESFDTAALRVTVAGGARVLFYVSHAVPSSVGPLIDYEFEEARLSCIAPGRFIARFRNGSVADYGSPEGGPLEKLLRVAEEVRAKKEPACSIDDALPHLKCVEAAHASSPIVDVPPELIKRTKVDETDELVWIEGAQAALTLAYTEGVLPSEVGVVPWARGGRTISID